MPPPMQGCCAHDHDCEEADCGPAWSLHKHIALDKVRCLNEAAPGSCRGVFRPWAARLDFGAAPPLESHPGDPELLLHVPFDGQVVLKAICIIGGTDGTAPSKLRAYVNREGLDFSSAADTPAVQEWELVADNSAGAVEYPTHVPRFSGVYCLDLLLEGAQGADLSRVHFVGLKGEHQQAKRQAVQAVYEARALPKDHKVPGAPRGSAWGTGR